MEKCPIPDVTILGDQVKSLTPEKQRNHLLDSFQHNK